MYGLTTLGLIHTAISLVAVACGFIALFRERHISLKSTLGKTYLWTTALTAVTGLFIFQHGGFGPPHVLSILTLLALAAALLVGAFGVFGAGSRYVVLISMTATLLFHMIPAFTETLTRLPLGAPVLASAEAPAFKTIYGGLFLLFAIGLAWQLRWLKRQPPAA